MKTQMNKDIRSLLESSGFEIYSIRKTKRMVGWRRYDFHARLRSRMSDHSGTPEYFYQIELLHNDKYQPDDYDRAALILDEAGYKTRVDHRDGLRVYIK